ncbi:MAG: hypothetical protein CVU05_15525 [Bacteroidetes bacterium HGW-Bacteroidetes-21]|jgi:hypothetical protein|nr:MAG: hypothetical protein CVU05_15525 [Bacteroidetes bacterium HGW-Bacteroidetes-21]
METKESMKKILVRKSQRYIIEINSFDNEVINMSPEQQELNQKKVENLINDIYLDESYKILEDILLRKTDN